MNRFHLVTLSLLAGLVFVACAPARTTFATKPGSPIAFDTAASDAKAIEVADKVYAAVGGDAWKEAKEIRWQQEVKVDGKPVLEYTHSWDRWNGRHRAEHRMGANVAVSMYEIYSETGAAFLRAQGKRMANRMSAGDQAKALKSARARFEEDHVAVFLPFLMQSPGAILNYVGERNGDDGKPQYTELKLTFAPGVRNQDGGAYYVVVRNDDHLIEQVEIVRPGSADDERIGYRWTEWKDVRGLKLAQGRENIGYKGETIHYWNFQVSDLPDDTRYVPDVTTAGQ